MKVQNASSSLASTLFLPTKLSHLVSGLRGTKKWMERWSLASETHTHTHTHIYRGVQLKNPPRCAKQPHLDEVLMTLAGPERGVNK